MLTYVATITFETSIFLLVKSILFQYFTEILDNSKKINKVIKYILKEKKDTSGKTFMQTLIEQTIPDLVIIASNIYTDKKDEIQYETNTSRLILLNLFAHLKEGEITLSEEILNIFDKSVVEYLDTFIVKTIEMWHVNAENIFKYFINNYRCLATLICLIEHK
jgi:ribosomal protein L30E